MENLIATLDITFFNHSIDILQSTSENKCSNILQNFLDNSNEIGPLRWFETEPDSIQFIQNVKYYIFCNNSIYLQNETAVINPRAGIFNSKMCC